MSTMRQAVTSLMTSAIISKVLNFSSNIIITRVIGNQILGTGSLRLNDLLFLAPQVLAFEGLRRAAYRSTSEKQSLINVSWLAVPVAFIFTLFFATWMFMYPPPTHVRLISYHKSILYTIFAIVIAAITEPVFIVAQSELRIKLRANIEIISVFGKCLSMLYLAIYSNQHLEAFAISNLVYTIIACGCYWGYFLGVVGHAPLPKRAAVIDKNMKSTVAVFWRQSLQKWLLENGEKVVLAFMGNAEQQGVYVVVERLGSIVVRLLLQPVEEMTLTTLGKLRDKRRRTLFRNWFLLVTFVGLTFACYAPAYVHLLLRLLYGNAIANKTSAPFALAWYCIYVLFMAINGMLEAFIQGTASLDDITQYNRWMLVFTLIYMCSVIYLLPLFGAAGLIMANIIKMTCRISVCITYYLHEPFTSLLPHKRVLALCFVSFILTQLSSKYTYNHDLWFICMHICIGIACWTMTACVVWRYHATQLKRIDKID